MIPLVEVTARYSPTNSGYDLAVHIYCLPDEGPISADTLEKTVLGVAMSSYDGASNGNRTRGGIRKASEMYVRLRAIRSDRGRLWTDIIQSHCFPKPLPSLAVIL